MKIASDVIAVVALDGTTGSSSLEPDDPATNAAGRPGALHGDGRSAGRNTSTRCGHAIRRAERGRAAWLLVGVVAAALPVLFVGVVRRGGERTGIAPAPSTTNAPVDPPTSSTGTLTAPAPLGTATSRPHARRAAAVDESPAEPAPRPAREPNVARETRVRVLVLDASSGGTVPHASIELRWQDATGDEHVALRRADESGRLEVEAAPGTCSVVAWSGSRAGGPEVADVRAGRDTNVRVDLTPVRPVTGRVVDAHTGAPVEGALVSFWTFAELDRVRTGADGVFRHPRFPAASPAQQLRVEAPGYGGTVRYVEIDGSGRWYVFSPTGDEGLLEQDGDPWVEVELVPELVVRGRVVDPLRRPVVGAAVRAEGFYRVLPSVASRDEARAITDEGGRFELAGLRSDIGHGLWIEAQGFSQARLELAADAPTPQEVGDVTLEPEHVVAGVVLAPDGLPAADIGVELRLAALATDEADAKALDVAVRIGGNVHRVRTRGDGTFVFPGLPPGTYRLRVTRDRAALNTLELELTDEVIDELVLHLPPETLTLTGEVRDGHGDAVAGAEVRLERFGHVGATTTDGDGRFRVAGLDAEASYELTASATCPRTGALLSARRSVWSYENALLRLSGR